MNVAIVGERERMDDSDRLVVTDIIHELFKEHDQRLVVISVGCDRGVGYHVMQLCKKEEIKFAEMRVKFEGKMFPRQTFGQLFKARNLSLLNVCDFFYVFLGPNPRGLIQELVEPAKEKVGPERVRVYPYMGA
jgi:hypothetical protein